MHVMKKELVIFTLRMSRDLHKKLKVKAAEEERSCQEMISQLLSEYLKENMGKIK